MEALFNQATRTAELLQKRSPEDQLEMLDTALDEGYATIISGSDRFGCYIIEWHGISGGGNYALEAIANWITRALREAEKAA